MRWQEFTAKKYPKRGKYFICVGEDWHMYLGKASYIEGWDDDGEWHDGEPAVTLNGNSLTITEALSDNLIDYWAYVNINPLLEMVKRPFVKCRPDVVGEQFVVTEDEMSGKRWQEQLERNKFLYKVEK